MNSVLTTTPHPKLIETLFAHKAKSSFVFKDVIGLHGNNHIAITRIDSKHKILVFSSTPALEFDLFSKNLWCFDNTYNPAWYHLGIASLWEDLYTETHYDELYYARQIKHHFSTGLSLTIFEKDMHYIYSLGFGAEKQQLLSYKDDFIKIGHYCRNLLESCFMEVEG